MKWRKFGFIIHYMKIKLEGMNFRVLINKCIDSGIGIRNIIIKDETEATMEIKGEDYHEFRSAAANSYKVYVINEGGIKALLYVLRKNTIALIGTFMIGALIFFQGTYVAEIQVEGYNSVDETSIREVMREAGLCEGMKKPDNYGTVKKALYENFGEITWVGIFEKGRFVKVSIAEAGKMEELKYGETTPINIVAGKSGMIETILPLNGYARVQKGDYVNEGDVLISGKLKYQSTDYSKGDDFMYQYLHADGVALARVPEYFTYYVEKNRRILKETGKNFFGINLSVGEICIDTACKTNKYKYSEREEREIINLKNPIPIRIAMVKIKEVKLEEIELSKEEIKEAVEAKLREYEKENMAGRERIITSEIEYMQSENIVSAKVMAETLREIGVEKPIKIKKKKNV